MSAADSGTDDRPLYRRVHLHGSLEGDVVTNNLEGSHLLIDLTGAPTLETIIEEVASQWNEYLADDSDRNQPFDELSDVAKAFLSDVINLRITQLTPVQQLAFIIMLGQEGTAVTPDVEDILEGQVYDAIREAHDNPYLQDE